MAKTSVLEIARKETATHSYKKFSPITLGPAFAAVALFFLGLIAIPFLIYRKLFTNGQSQH